ncbi:MAG TPA: mannosyltransferase family protein [Chloroflexia bacterium]|nr:mannosyltransferase family protein [Chloroflexia bacterium]
MAGPARLRAFLAAHQEPLAILIGVRIGLTLLALLAGMSIPALPPGGTAPYHLPPAPVLWDRLVGVWAHWDGLWYLQIAGAGYRAGDGTTAFLPLYPWLVGALGTLLGSRYLVAGVLLSALVFAGVLVLLYDLVRTEYAPDLAPRATLYLAIFPTAFFFWAIYSEGLFLLLALGMFAAAGRRRWLLAGACLAAALWTRPFGVLLFPCLVLEMVTNRSPSPQGEGLGARPVGAAEQSVRRAARSTTAAALALPVAAGAALLAWSAAALGDPLVFLTTQAEWNRAFSWPWTTVANAFKVAGETEFAFQVENQSWFYLASLIVLAVLAAAGWLRVDGRPLLRTPHALYLTLGLLFALFSATPRNPLLSLPRFALVLFPAFVVLAIAGRRAWVHYTILAVSLLLLALYTIRFTNWYWVA